MISTVLVTVKRLLIGVLGLYIVFGWTLLYFKPTYMGVDLTWLAIPSIVMLLYTIGSTLDNKE